MKITEYTAEVLIDVIVRRMIILRLKTTVRSEYRDCFEGIMLGLGYIFKGTDM